MGPPGGPNQKWRISSASIRRDYAARGGSGLDPVAGLEDPADRGEAERQEHERHPEAGPDAHVGDAEEAPAKPADEVNDRISERQLLPERGEHLDGVEAPAEKRER